MIGVKLGIVTHLDNLLKASNVKLQGAAIYNFGEYWWDERPADGTKLTLSMCFKTGSLDEYGITPFLDYGFASLPNIGYLKSEEEVIVHRNSTMASAKDAKNRRDSIMFFHRPKDDNYDPSTYIKWAVVAEGWNMGVNEWIPAKSEQGGNT